MLAPGTISVSNEFFLSEQEHTMVWEAAAGQGLQGGQSGQIVGQVPMEGLTIEGCTLHIRAHTMHTHHTHIIHISNTDLTYRSHIQISHI